ncbi:MAG: hypothetical protein BWY85_00223 [Firmicutes bacterium ADurb.Bin506]|nr:MAG: hypothetical protein BWY85_00223 [Firmicutes bacterium ADurb.Bin506]
MNRYRITFTSPDGSEDTYGVTERTEGAARKAFRSYWKACGTRTPDITSIELEHEGVGATKQQEAVEQKYTDTGKVFAKTHILELDAVPASHYEEKEKYDLYIDYFDNPTEAEKHRQDALRA